MITNKPFEWYMEEVGTLIEAYTDTLLKLSGASHFQWLVLNVIDRHQELHFRNLYPEVKYYCSKGKAKKITKSLMDIGWLQVNGKKYKLTEAGRNIIENIERKRKKITADIGERQYTSAVNVLVKVISNIHSEFQSHII